MCSALCSILQFIKHCEPNQNLKQRTSHSTTVSLNEKNKNQQHTHTTVYVFFWLIHFNDIWHGVWLRFLFSYTLDAAKIQDDFFLESALFLHGKTPCASHRLRSQIAHTHLVKGLFIISKTWGTSLLYFVILGVCLIHMASTYIYGTDGKHFGTYGKH